MRVLHLIETLSRGGAEHQLLNLLPALGQVGVECEVAALWSPYELAESFIERGIIAHRLEIGHRWDLLRTTSRLARLQSAGRYDVVHAHLFHAGLPVAILRLFGKIPKSVITFHNDGYDAYPPAGAVKRLRRSADGWLTRNGFDAHVAVSEGAADSARRHLGLGRVEVIPNGLDFGELKSAEQVAHIDVCARYGIPADRPLVVMPGRLVWEKGHRIFLEAWTEVQRHCPRAFGVIVGHGPLLDEITGLITAKGLQGTLRLIPGCAQSELFALVHACDVVAIPSLFEGWGMVVAEAMALGRAIVCTGVGGIPDVIGDPPTALVVKPGDAGTLAGGIIALLESPGQREALGAQARKRARECFSVDVAAEAYMQLYQSILHGAK